MTLNYVFIFACCYSAAIATSNTKYVVNLDSGLYCCDGECKKYVDTSTIEVQWYNESTSYMCGDITTLQTFQDNTVMEIVLEKETSGKYEVVFTLDICEFCKEIGREDSNYYKYFKYIGFPDYCPFDAGSYPVKNLVLDTDDLNLNNNHIGQYRAVVNFYHNPEGDCKTKEFLYCLKIDVCVEPE